jgi:hypothetical protein
MILSKVWDPADELPADIQEIVTREWEDGQHWSRKWEYGMALLAQQAWYDQSGAERPQGPIYDVGGSGSPFWKMVNPYVTTIIDPREGKDLAEQLRLGAGLASEVYCISVIEHVDKLDQFLYHLSCLVAPGGLLFLTTDFCDMPGKPEDVCHWHWMRKRIFNDSALRGAAYDLMKYGTFNLLGGVIDYRWHGPIETWGYAPASLALVKRR